MKISKGQKHVPVLEREVLELLNPTKGDKYLDLTAGYGGHSGKVLEQIGESGEMTLVDRDLEAVEFLKIKFKNHKNVKILHRDFYRASIDLLKSGEKFDVILADLGVSSVHLNNKNRGFSFAQEGPLDMRMDQSINKTAADIVNGSSIDELAKILAEYGEIRGAKKLASFIIENRPYNSTSQLAAIVAKTVRKRRKTHPATAVFQAIRIAVNEEITQIEQSLPIWIELLNTKGRLGVISFHSLEDRLVKRAFKDNGGDWYDAKLQIVTKNPIVSRDQEVVFNPRARSAKLRVAQRK